MSPKNNKKADMFCMKFSSTPNTSVQKCLYPLFQNQRSHFLLPPLFWRISQPSDQDQHNGKRTYCQLPPLLFWINLKDTASHIFMDSLVVDHSPEYFLNFLQTCISHNCWAKFSNKSSQDYWEMHLWVKNLNLLIFTHASTQNPLPGSYHHLQGEGNYSFPPGSVFWKSFFP